jgi:hypothetical protein
LVFCEKQLANFALSLGGKLAIAGVRELAQNVWESARGGETYRPIPAGSVALHLSARRDQMLRGFRDGEQAKRIRGCDPNPVGDSVDPRCVRDPEKSEIGEQASGDDETSRVASWAAAEDGCERSSGGELS